MMPTHRRAKRSVWQVDMTTSLAFLAPDLVKAAIEGTIAGNGRWGDVPRALTQGGWCWSPTR
jgi:hypothetical protein